ncbi:MAG: cupin domain-containing protein [Balneolaceae bacterium]
MEKSSAVIKSDGYTWEGIKKKEYKTEGTNFKQIHRYTLLGDEYRDLNTQTRYFEIQPGGYSSLESHRHPHSVVVIRGKGEVILDNSITELKTHDVVFIAPETIHQFHASSKEPLGFICVVDRYRDRPVIPSDETISRVITDEKILKKIQK